MRISTIALFAMAMLCLAATGVRAEEPEQNSPETTVVPVEFAAHRHEVVISADKAATTEVDNSVIHVDDNNRLVGLSN
jgi:hypothetical protein